MPPPMIFPFMSDEDRAAIRRSAEEREEEYRRGMRDIERDKAATRKLIEEAREEHRRKKRDIDRELAASSRRSEEVAERLKKRLAKEEEEYRRASEEMMRQIQAIRRLPAGARKSEWDALLDRELDRFYQYDPYPTEEITQ